MATLTEIEKLKLEKILAMEGGYVLDFSNQGFHTFVYNTVKRNIFDRKYEAFGSSKAKRLRAFWMAESDIIVGRLMEEMLLYLQTKVSIEDEGVALNQNLFNQCQQIAYRLQGKNAGTNVDSNSEDEFLKREFDKVSLSEIAIDNSLIPILEGRLTEVRKCLEKGAALSSIFMCGSILEGLLLGIASRRSREFNSSSCSPKNGSSGKVKPFHEWTLNNFIDVAHDLKLLGLDVKKYSHSLRDFRNYIHPYEQMSSGFNPDEHTAKICWQVLKAALYDLKTKCK